MCASIADTITFRPTMPGGQGFIADQITIVRPADPDAMLLAKFRQYEKIDGALEMLADQARPDKAMEQLLIDEANALWEDIGNIPAQTIAGIAAKLQMLAPMAGLVIDSTSSPSEIFGAKLVEDAQRLAKLAPLNSATV